MKPIYSFLLVGFLSLATVVVTQGNDFKKKDMIALDVGVRPDAVGEIPLFLNSDYIAEETHEVVKYFEPGSPKTLKGFVTVALKPPIGFI